MPLKLYLILLVVMFGVCFTIEEFGSKKTTPGKYLRSLLGHHDLHEFLAEKSIEFEMPYDTEVAECDYKTMTAKRFFNDYVK